MSKRASIFPAILLTTVALAAATPQPVTLVICAPGYPGSTKEAQPSMDTLAKAVSAAAGTPTLPVAAEYYETEDAGVARLKAAAPSLALVPLPFYLSHASALKLQAARLRRSRKTGSRTVTWTLVAKKGRVASPADLSGFTIVSLAGYAPGFIKNVALAKWGSLPADVTFQANGQVLSALRKAANGDRIAVLLDATQAASLPTLPFAAELSVVATSPPVPGIVVCTVGATATTDVGDPARGGVAQARPDSGRTRRARRRSASRDSSPWTQRRSPPRERPIAPRPRLKRR